MACVGRPAQAASPPDILVVAQPLDDIVSLDPGAAFELSSIQATNSLYQRLAQPDRDHPETLRPTLASSWRVGADGHSIEFELLAAASFASGNPVRPEDVIFSLRRVVRLNLPAAIVLNELGWTPENVDGFLTKLDARHVRVSWPKNVGAAFVLNLLAAPVASIVDATEVARHEVNGDTGHQWLNSHSAGSGPFKMRRYIPHEALVLDANPRSPGDVPRLKTIVMRNVADAATRRLLVEVGDADIARELGPDQIAALRGEPGLKTFEAPAAAVYYIMLNTASKTNPVLKNPAVWEALRWLVDYRGIAVNLLQGQYDVHQTMLPAGLPGALTTTPYHLDVERAKRILAAAGLGAGFDLTFDVFNQPPNTDIAQSLQATFARAGIRLKILAAEPAEVYIHSRTRAYEAMWLFWIPDYFDANSTASAFASNSESGAHTVAWRAGWDIPQLSQQTRAALEERDPQARLRMYATIQEEIQRRSPYIFALQGRTELILRNRVKGYSQGLGPEMVYYDRVTK